MEHFMSLPQLDAWVVFILTSDAGVHIVLQADQDMCSTLAFLLNHWCKFP